MANWISLNLSESDGIDSQILNTGAFGDAGELGGRVRVRLSCHDYLPAVLHIGLWDRAWVLNCWRSVSFGRG